MTAVRWPAHASVALLGVVLFGARVDAQGQPGHDPPQEAPGQPRRREVGQFPDRMQPRAPADGQHLIDLRNKPPGTPEHGPRAEHAGPQHGAAEHGEHAGHAEHDENAAPEPINWWHGLLGEKADAPPSLLWREPGEPPPFLASVINFALLVFIVVRFGKKPLAAALSKRKDTIVRDLEDARRMREAAEQRLGEYEAKLAKIHEELDRLRREFRDQGERDKQRILAEANERRERMKKDAEILLSQEVKQIRQELVVEVVAEATRLARDLLAKEMTLGDHDRFADAFLAEIRSGAKRNGAGTTRGGAS